MGGTVNWRYDSLPNVSLYMSGGLAENEVDDDDTKRSHFDQEFNWRIDEDSDEFIIRIKRTPEFAAKNGHTNVALRIEGGISENPDGSVKFDGGIGSGESVSTFGLSFKISHHETTSSSKEEEEEEEPEEKEVAFFDHAQHKLHLASEYFYKDMPRAYCDACTEPIDRAKWVYRCPVDATCDYCVHAACAQFPRTIRHPSHPKHPLKLLKLLKLDLHTPGVQCDVCKGAIPHAGMRYQCTKCHFDAHPVCPAAEGDDREEEDPGEEEEAEDREEEEEGEEWDASKHLGMTPEQYLAHLQQKQILQARIQAIQLESTRQTAAMIANSGQTMLDLTRGYTYRW